MRHSRPHPYPRHSPDFGVPQGPGLYGDGRDGKVAQDPDPLPYTSGSEWKLPLGRGPQPVSKDYHRRKVPPSEDHYPFHPFPQWVAGR